MKLSQTSKAHLFGYFMLFIPVGWALAQSWTNLFGQALQVSYVNVLVLAFVSIILASQALQIRQALKSEEHKLRLGAPVIAKFVVLAMAVSRVSAVTGGIYLGICTYYLTHDVGEISRSAIAPSVLSAGLSITLVVIALWIERLTKLPPENQATGSDT